LRTLAATLPVFSYLQPFVMGVFTYTKFGQFTYEGKIYAWMFDGDTHTLLVKHTGDEVLRHQLKYPVYGKEINSDFAKQCLATHPAAKT
jgi:hypothetical protein